MTIDQDKLGELVGTFVADLGATIAAGNVVVGHRLGLYRSLAGAPATADRDTVAVPAADPGQLGAAVSLLGREHIPVSQIGLRLPSLDEAFLRITGERAR